MPVPHDRTRRRFVRSAAVLLGTGLVGCTSDATELGGSEPEDTPISAECEREHQEVSDLSLWNQHTEAHSVTVVVMGVREDGSSEPVYEESFDLDADEKVYRDVVFDPTREDIERYDDYVARATSEDGQSDSRSIYSTVVSSPLRFTVHVTFEADGELVVAEMHGDYDGGTPPC